MNLNANLGNLLGNPFKQGIKKYVYDMIQERYTEQHNETLDHLVSQVITEKDYTSIAKLIADIYESGFMRANKEYRETLKRLGYDVKIVSENKSNLIGKSIFQEKLG